MYCTAFPTLTTAWSQRHLPSLPGSHSPDQHLSMPPLVPQHCESTAQDWRAQQITSQGERIPLQGGNGGVGGECYVSGQRSTALCLQYCNGVGLVTMNVLVKLMYISWETTSSLEHMNPLPLNISRVTRELPKKL